MTSDNRSHTVSTLAPEKVLEEASARAADYMFSAFPVRCASCGQFIGLKAAMEGKAVHYFEPDNHFGPEISEWTCWKCRLKENTARSPSTDSR